MYFEKHVKANQLLSINCISYNVHELYCESTYINILGMYVYVCAYLNVVACVSVFLLSPLCIASERFALTLLSSLRCFTSHMQAHTHTHTYIRHVCG